MCSWLSWLGVLLIVVLLFQSGWLLWILWSLRFQVIEVLLGHSHLEGEHFVILSVGYKHLVKSSQVLIVLIHHAQDIHSIVLDLLNRISIQSQTLQVVKLIQLASLVQVVEEVTVQIQSLQLWEVQELALYRLQMAVRQVEPHESIWFKHDLIEGFTQAHDRSNWIILEEQSLGLFPHNDLLGCFSFLLLGLATAQLVLIAANQRDVMIHEEVGNDLTLGSSDDNLFLLLLEVFLLLFWLILLCVHIVLHKIR